MEVFWSKHGPILKINSYYMYYNNCVIAVQDNLHSCSNTMAVKVASLHSRSGAIAPPSGQMDSSKIYV